MDSDSEESVSHASTYMDEDAESQQGGRGAKGTRARVLTLENSNGVEGEEDDRVGEIIALGGMMSTGGIERRRSALQPPSHMHTNSAPILSFPPSSNSATNANPAAPLDLSTVVPPPDKSGWLYKRGNLNSSWKKRWFVLRYQTLKYYKKSGDSKPKGFIPLSAALITPGTSEKMRRLFGWEIGSMKYSRVFIIHADSESEMNEWIDCLQKNIEYVSLVIEREKLSRNPNAQNQQQQASSSLQHQLSFASLKKKAPSSTLLDLDFTEDYLKNQIGLQPRFSQWRREPARLGFEESQAKYVQVSSLRQDSRLPNASCFAIHNAANLIAVGSGSAYEEVRERGVVQIVGVNTLETASSLNQVTRFGEDIQERAEEQIAAQNGRGGGKRKGTYEEEAGDAPSLSLLSPCTGSASSLCWVDDRFFLGSTGGVVAMYSLPENLSNCAGLQPNQILVHEKAREVQRAAPGKWGFSSSIRALDLNPDKRQLLTIGNQMFHIWDTDRGAMISTEVGSNNAAPIFAAQWNPHASNEFIVGGEEGAIRLIDTRSLSGVSSKPAWSTPHAHAASVRSMAFSPLVPWWIASAGDDGLVKVWDTRFGGEPVRVLSGHASAVRKVEWSKSHCEMLVSGGADKSVKVWNMRIGPHYSVYTHSPSNTDFTAPVIHCSFSPINPFQVLIGSQNGEVASMQMQREMMGAYVVQRSAPKAQPGVDGKKEEEKGNDLTATGSPASICDPQPTMVRSALDEQQEREIAHLLYLRDYDRGFKAVASLAQKYWTLQQYPFANQLLKLTGQTLFPLAAAEPSQSPVQSNTLKVFNSLLTDLCRFLPPKVVEYSQCDEQTKQRIEFLGLRLLVSDRIQQNQSAGLLAMADKICKHLSAPASINTTSPTNATATLTSMQDATSLDQFDSGTLEKMAMVIVKQDLLRGIDFCIRIARTLKDAGNFALFIGIARGIFHPTLYEKMDESSSAAASFSYIKTLSPLAHTVIGSTGLHTSRDDESESSESESSTNSVSSSGTQGSRKPSMDLGGRPAVRTSVSMASPPPATSPQSMVTARGSIVVGNEVQHAQITLDRDLRNPKIVLSQLSLLREMCRILSSDDQSDPSAARFNPYLAIQPPAVASRITLDSLGFPPISTATAKEICKLYEENKEPQKLLPSVLHFLYFHALIVQKKYDLVFVAATKIGSNSILKSYQFANILEGVMNEITVPKFNKFLDRLLSKEATKSSAAAAIGANLPKLQAASLTILNMLFNMDYLPDRLSSILPKYLREFHDELKKTLTEIGNNSAYVPTASYMTARQDCKAKVEGILQQMARIKTHSKIVGEPHCAEQVIEFQQMLKKFLQD
jgi:WD40 repeat protein